MIWLWQSFFYGCNIPFSVADSVHFKNFIYGLRPSYNVPTRKQLSSQLLDTLFSSIKQEAVISSRCVLLIDGWKNESNNTKNVAVMLQSKGQILFLDSWDLSGQHETGEKLAEIIDEATELAKEMYQVQVHAVVSDNAANMKKMGRLTPLLHQTCNSHTAELLAKDLVSKPLVAQVNTVQKYFSRPDFEKKMCDNGGHKTILPCETRWCSNRDSFRNFLINLPAMKKCAIQEDLEEVTKKLFDQNFIKQVEDGVKLLDPVCDIINTCQKNSSNIADAAEKWLKMQLPEGFESLNEKVKKRMDYALSDASLTANYLHPKYCGRLLSSDHLDKVDDFLLEELDAEGLENLSSFRLKGVFKILNDKCVTNADAFWGNAIRRNQKLSELALKLLSIPASSAALERLFSNWSFVHNRLRNRLGPEKSKKLLFIYHTMKLKDQNCSDY